MTAPVQAGAEAALIAQYNAQAQQLRNTLAAFLTRLWASLQGDWRAANEDRFVAQAVPVSQGAQRAMSAATTAYLARLISAMTGTPPRIPAVPQARVTGEALRGVDPGVVYRRPLEQARYALSQGKSLDQASAIGARRAESIGLTDLQLAKTHTAQKVMGADGRIVGYRRVLTGAHSCALCLIASTQRYHKAKLMPIHPGCVPAGSRVSASGVVAVTRRRYAGELAIIRTSAGDEVTVTANHPILTDQGWVPGHLVSEGDNAVRSRSGHRTVNGGPHESQRPALIEDVWRAASVTGVVRVPLAPEDFHGDGSDGEVDVIWTNGDLAPIGDVTFGQPCGERAFMDRQFGRLTLPGGGALASLLPGGLTPCGSNMGGGELLGPLLGGHLCGAHQPSLGAASDGDVMVLEQLADRAALDTVLGSQGVFGETADVLGGDLRGWEFTPGAPACRFDPPAVEFTGEGRHSHASIGRRLLESLSGQVVLDRVLEVRRVYSTTHVYNLHAAEGWYSANSHIVSNCDCSVAPLIGTRDPGQVIDETTLEAVHDAVARDLGAKYVDRGARSPLDYRKVVIEHHHGELGAVLGVKGQHFQGKPA